MDDYISRQALIDSYCSQDCGIKYEDCNFKGCFEIKIMQEQPSADVVEVVRCKDCKDYDIINQPYDEGFCRKLNYSVDKDSFCSYGERRTE